MAGVNAGHYARELMWNCAERARKVGNTSDPKSVLVYAASQTRSQGTAATLIASLYGQVSLHLGVLVVKFIVTVFDLRCHYILALN